MREDELPLSLAAQSKIRTVVSIKTKCFKLWITFFSSLLSWVFYLSQAVLGALFCIIPDPHSNPIKLLFFKKMRNMRFVGRLNDLVKLTRVDNSIARINLKCLALKWCSLLELLSDSQVSPGPVLPLQETRGAFHSVLHSHRHMPFLALWSKWRSKQTTSLL